MFQASRFNI